MDRKRRFDMLSVVSFGIHTAVRNRLQKAIESSAAGPELQRRLRPWFFYEYFFDRPALLYGETSECVAFAPFLKRLVVEREFMAVPRRSQDTLLGRPGPGPALPGGLDSGWTGVRTVPTTKANVLQHWPEHVPFAQAIPKSLILRLLHGAWSEAEKAELEQEGGRALDGLQRFAHGLGDAERRSFTDLDSGSFTYKKGAVSLSAGFSRRFANHDYESWCNSYAEESRDSWQKEFLACIYPWLQSSPLTDESGSESDRLFEILACSISSRVLFLGELILFIPPIEESVLRSHAYELLREALHGAVDDLYLPMLTLYENYAAEADLQLHLEKAEEAQRLNDPEWQSKLPPALSADRWRGILPYLEEVGTHGIAETGPGGWPSSPESPEDPAANPFLQLLRFVPPSTLKLRGELSRLAKAVRERSPGEIEEATSNCRRGADAVRAVVARLAEARDYPPWVSMLDRCLGDLLDTLNGPGNPDPRSVDEVRVALGRAEKSFSALLSDFELSLVQLWADRLRWVFTDPRAVVESLVFKKYLIASPGMVACIRAAMNIRHAKSNGEVKTALIVGGAGSGKDSMARLAQLFSPGYRFGRRAVLNMAMFRPKESAVPLLLGLNVHYSIGASDARSSLGIAGVFQQSLLGDGNPDSSEQKDRAESAEATRGFTFILDELNSLDIDSQGALLRVLENGELQALGSIGTTGLNCLVVGVMNEDPDLIMKKRTLDNLLRDESLFGGIVGETLYELLRGQRRLRDDLYYRLARGGEIRIPELRHRREDLPILAYFILDEYRKSIPKISAHDEWDVDLEAYEVLMRPSLLWRGNIRELQAVCRRMLDLALEEQKEARSVRLEILPRHAESAVGEVARERGRKTSEGPH